MSRNGQINGPDSQKLFRHLAESVTGKTTEQRAETEPNQEAQKKQNFLDEPTCLAKSNCSSDSTLPGTQSKKKPCPLQSNLQK